MCRTEDTIGIVADDREPRGAVTGFLERMGGVEVAVARLATGDYRVDDRLLFERKTVPDFALSIVDGRLFSQMARLAGSVCRGVLVLEGAESGLDETGVRREALQGALITVSLVLGIPVLRSRDPAETAWLMLAAARQARQDAGGAVQRHGCRPAGRRRRQLYILQGLPGIGRERAERLLQVFGSVEAVFSAPCEELEAVAGIGAKTARNIRWAVSEGVLTYGCAGFSRIDG